MDRLQTYLTVFYILLRCLICAGHLSNVQHEHKDTKQESGTPVPPISDHRFFLHEIFSKYGHNGQMTFEGFEHLLESLGLGNIIITDHDVQAHKDNEFRNTHTSHNHSKKVDLVTSPPNKDVTPSSRHIHGSTHTHPTSNTFLTSSNSHTHPRHYDHDNHIATDRSKNHEGEPSRHHHYQTEVITRSGAEISSTGKPPESVYRYNLRDVMIPELLVNISTLVDQHRELDQQSTNVVIEQCLSPRDILEAFGINQSSSLNPVSFLHLCPAIIYELDQGHCLFRNRHDERQKTIATLHQWIYSSVAVLVISLCGLLSVAVIPIMQKWFYHTLLQFFVGLAIGSLSGDALLHLLPHAMLGGEDSHSHNDPLASIQSEKIVIWRGFAALGGIFFFFIAERLLGTYATYRRRKKQQKIDKFNELQVVPPNTVLHRDSVGEKLSQYKKSSYEFEKNGKEMIKMLDADSFPSRKSSTHECGLSSGLSLNSSPTSLELDCSITLHEHPPEYMNGHAHHGHGHGHSHEVPDSVSAVAWMVIMGDGLHNFCDGLAIGAAFASGIEGGISTTVAVFCHELPHELGDFAMLLKTGMKVKQALLYNGLSSILCFIGMVIGVSLGNVESATSWVFAGTAGMFLYIALVDMLPELTSSEPTSGTPTHQLAVQVLGISFGVSIMLLIANYEQELQNLIS